MLRICIVALTLSVSTIASAQQFTAAQRDACKGDYEKYCSNVMPGGGRVLACLSKESAKLTDACRAAVSTAAAK